MEMIFCVVVSILSASDVPVSVSAPAATTFDSASLEAYTREITSVESDFGKTPVTTLAGKEAFIARYQAILDKYPNYPKSVELERRIAHLWHGPFRDGTGENREKAIERYQSIVQRYSPDLPAVKDVLLTLAGLCSEATPEQSKRHYETALKTYPDDDRVRLQSYMGLGRLARRESNNALAEEYFAQVLNYSPSTIQKDGSRDSMIIGSQRSNAVSELCSMHLDLTLPPGELLIAVDNLRKRYPAMMAVNPEAVEYYRRIALDRLKEEQKRGAAETIASPSATESSSGLSGQQ